MHNQYSPLWKCSKLFIPPQTDGMIRFCFNIGCSESKVIFKWRRTKTTHMVKRLFEKQTFTPCAFHSVSAKTLSVTNKHSRTRSTHKKARLEPAIIDAQKLAQNVFPPWIWRTLRPPSCLSSGWGELVLGTGSNMPFCAWGVLMLMFIR